MPLTGEADLDRDPLRERAGLPLRDLFTGVPLRDRDLALPADACDRDRGLPERWDPAGLFEPERDLAEPERERCDPDGDCEREADRDLPDCRDPERDRLEPGELERLRFCGVPERERFACGEFDLESWCSKEYPGVGAACGVPLRLRLPRLESESEPDAETTQKMPSMECQTQVLYVILNLLTRSFTVPLSSHVVVNLDLMVFSPNQSQIPQKLSKITNF